MESDWRVANQQALMREIDRLRQALESRTCSPSDYELPIALAQLCRAFGLSNFDRDLLLLCAGMELDANWGSLCATAQGDPKRNYPTFGLALAVLDSPDWGAMTAESPLRRWRLIEMGASNALIAAPLRIDDRILYHLTGFSTLDERLMPYVQLVKTEMLLAESHLQLAAQLVALWKPDAAELPIAQLCGSEITSKRSIAAHACRQLGLRLYALSAHAIPTNLNDLHPFIQLWQREAILSQSALLIDCDTLQTSDPARDSALTLLLDRLNTPIILTSLDRRPPLHRSIVTLDVPKPTVAEQRLLWQQLLDCPPDEIDTLVAHFNLDCATIRSIALRKVGDHASTQSLSLWNLCRSSARPQLEDLAQRIEAAASWEDLVLPTAQRQVLEEAAAHLRQRMQVYDRWGFAGKGDRGLGISALFAGASGTGKTMAAEVLAATLQLDLYRIDLSGTVSKYIGETEKNLRRIFDAAEAGGAILLFDEADALFGKRSEVKDSHDRYANLEVSYLLQRMEAYQGLAILTTNLKEAIDPAFLRRIRFIVKFPYPDAAQRQEIWRRVFPAATPTKALDFAKLARLNIAGGNIRNIALNAAFIAADAGEPVQMKHLLEAAKSEYLKLERSLTDSEVKGWV